MFRRELKIVVRCYGVMGIAGRQIRDPVKGHAGPGPGGDWEGIKKTERRVPSDLIPLAGVTTAHISIDSCSHPRPFGVLGHECLRPRHAVVPRERGIVILLQNLEDEGGCRGGMRMRS